MPQVAGPSPSIPDLLATDPVGMGPVVSMKKNRVFFVWFESRRLDHQRIQLEPVAGYHLNELRLTQSVIPKDLCSFLRQKAHRNPSFVDKTKLWWIRDITPPVNEIITGGAENDLMITIFPGHSGQGLSIQSQLVKMSFQYTVF
jgi:hypothetical protein